MYAYVGSRTTRERDARGEGISVFEVDQQSGSLERVQLVGDLVNPSYLTLSRDGQFLYTVHGDESEVSSFRVDRASGQLQFLNRQGTQGKNPVHLALDPSGRHLVVANHIGSSLAVLPVSTDGSLGALVQLVPLTGPIGPHRIRFEGGALTPAPVPYVVTREGAGPRHLAFHPHEPFAYVVNELDSTVTTYRVAPDTGALEPLQVLSALPATFTGNSRAAGIVIDPAGRTLYSSNRGHDSIAVFRIDPASGLLEFTGADPSQGRTPRFFTLAPSGRVLFVLNEDSDSIVAFSVDAGTGRLSPTGASVQCGSPVCMVFSA
jgi:6-phosphogluconolactonase